MLDGYQVTFMSSLSKSPIKILLTTNDTYNLKMVTDIIPTSVNYRGVATCYNVAVFYSQRKKLRSNAFHLLLLKLGLRDKFVA